MDINKMLSELRSERSRIDKAITALEELATTARSSVAASSQRAAKSAATTEAPVRRRRKMSAAARKRISDAAKARWAARRQARAK